MTKLRWFSSVSILCVLLAATGCRTCPPAPTTIKWPFRFQPHELTFTCADSYISTMVEQYSKERMIFSDDTNVVPDVAIASSMTIHKERHTSPMAWFNILTVPLGKFFFYFNVDAVSGADTVLTFSTGKKESFETIHEERYSHPGYLPEPKDGEDHKVLFYEDIKESEHVMLADKTARDIVVRSGVEFATRQPSTSLVTRVTAPKIEDLP
jgi:hypothetical protein